ncbi:MAG TPA: hypothetical protein VEF91_04880 [Verrucomicrobiae bacterium]|nr:hypothetical protein [Verrucomicrobiae bacterium]
MSRQLQDYMCKYVQEKTELLKGCLLAALNSKDQYLKLLNESLGTPTTSVDLQLCELLANAGLFREETKLNRDGRNEYKLFYLTDLGKEMAMQIKKET